ncbi:F-box domain-containing protein [Pleurostoma richardsiae]|uniref:F-box domain-containing protein n=1 Tax=Pleurostoma richardsiae TaxID=41990 RepID=A0AA38RF57_9PEZI|nr:F-box domain-containing protein [Pleurostoma richardsiae]
METLAGSVAHTPGSLAVLSPIDSLPTEILAQVFYFLDSPAPSDSRLHEQPGVAMLKAGYVPPLKIVSLVSRRWRCSVLPLLFQNVVFALGRWDRLLAAWEQDPCSALPCLEFLRVNRLEIYVRTVTLIVEDSMDSIYGVRGDTGRHDANGEHPVGGRNWEHDATHNGDNNWLWLLFFDALDPLRLTIIAPPRALASLLSRMLFLDDAWSFEMPHHVLSLSREDRLIKGPIGTAVETSSVGRPLTTTTITSFPFPQVVPDRSSPGCVQNRRRFPCQLFSLRPWTSLLLNEGSSMRVYATYEFFLKRPPSMLGALLGSEEYPNDVGLVPSTVRSLSYVGIFPLSSHFNTLVQHLPRVDRLFVQLVPRNDILKDRDEMKHIDPSDLWMERNTCYSLLMRELFDNTQRGNWAYLRELESGDAADRETWHMGVQYLRVSGGRGWRVEREGVLIKRDDGDEQTSGGDLTPTNDAFGGMASPQGSAFSDLGQGSPSSMLQGRLRRIAFNGTERLPLSSMWLYVTDMDP